MDAIMNNSALFLDMDKLQRNVAVILSSLPEGVALLPVLKDNAYGLGLETVARALDGVPGLGPFAVAHVSEGLALRQAGISREVLVMGGVLPCQLPAAAGGALTLAVGRLGLVPELAKVGAALGKKQRIHIKIDTGLHRIGVDPGEELAALIAELKGAVRWVDTVGAFSHFSNVSDEAETQRQYRRFLRGAAQLEEAGIPIPLRHISGSATSEYCPQYALDGVRVGRRMYLDHPTRPLGNIQEIASWRTWISQIKPRRAGETLGYGGKLRLEKDTLVATIGVGYGDGLNEGLVARRGPVLVCGERRALLGCCMDQSFVDVTGLSAAPGDEVTLFGSDSAGNFLSAQEVSLLVGDNEGCGLTSALSPRVARIYIGGKN